MWGSFWGKFKNLYREEMYSKASIEVVGKCNKQVKNKVLAMDPLHCLFSACVILTTAVPI